MPILDDGETEDDETFTVAIVSTTFGVASGLTEAIVTIVDDDQPTGGMK